MKLSASLKPEDSSVKISHSPRIISVQLSSDGGSSKILHSPRVRTKSLASGESKILQVPPHGQVQ